MSQTISETTNQLHVSGEVPALLERIEEITPLLMSQGAENEELGHLTDAAAQALHDAGVFRLGIPQDLGGYEAAPRQVIEVIEKLAYADASTGWAVMALQMITGTTAAYQGAEATAALFSDGGYHLMAGQGTRMGSATKVDGGYLLTGSWSFASGLPHASHIHTAAVVEETGEALIFTFPKEQARIVDNWDVMGLKATGSIDYSTENLFVPQAYTYNVATKDSVHGGALYRVGLANMSGINHAGWALGVARRMLDEMKVLAQKKSGTPGASVDTDQFVAEYAKAEAMLRSARALRHGRLGRQRSHTGRRRTPLRRAGDPHPAGPEPRHLVGPRGLHDCLQVGRHRRPARGRPAAILPRHARRHPACDLRPGGPAGLRPRPLRTGDKSRVGLLLARRE